MEWEKIADAFNFSIIRVEAIHSGLINASYKVETDTGNFIVQSLNTNVFKDITAIAENINHVGAYLKKYHPTYLFTYPLVNKTGNTLVYHHEHVYRAFSFLDNTITIQATSTEVEAYEAAYQFSTFTKKLAAFDIHKLHATIPRFHDLSFRFHHFEQAVNNNNDERKTKATKIIKALLQQKLIVKQYVYFIKHSDSLQRVMHHDTKISNVLFDKAGKGLCVIDLDTIMSGYLLSDVGDMLRTYIAEATEEEENLDLISVRKPFIQAIEKGYFEGLKNEINSFEIDNFYLYGRIMIFMQALRFITDYLEYDRYYGQKKEGHNLNRALNQFRLLQLFEEAIA